MLEFFSSILRANKDLPNLTQVSLKGEDLTEQQII